MDIEQVRPVTNIQLTFKIGWRLRISLPQKIKIMANRNWPQRVQTKKKENTHWFWHKTGCERTDELTVLARGFWVCVYELNWSVRLYRLYYWRQALLLWLFLCLAMMQQQPVESRQPFICRFFLKGSSRSLSRISLLSSHRHQTQQQMPSHHHHQVNPWPEFSLN